MKSFILPRAVGLLAVLALVALLAPTCASAQSADHAADRGAPAAATATVTPTQAQAALDVLQNPQKREQLISVLQTIAKAAPAAGAAAPASLPSTAAPPAQQPRPVVALQPHSLGAQLLFSARRWSRRLADDASATLQTLNSLPAVWRFAAQLRDDPTAALGLARAAGWLALVFAAALLLEFLTGRALQQPRSALTRRLPHGDGEQTRLLRLLPFALVGLALDLVPVAVFAAVGNLAVSMVPAIDESAGFVVIAIVNAYAACRAVICVARTLLSPEDKRLRLWRLGDEDAAFAFAWVGRLAVVAIFGNALVDAATLLGLDESAHDGFERIIALVLALMLIAIVIQSRRSVAGYIRRRGESRWWPWFAEAWPYLAIIAIASFWLGLSARSAGGLSSLYLSGMTIAAIVGARLLTIILLGALERIARSDPQLHDQPPGVAQRIAYYRRPLEAVANAVVVALCIIVVLQLWGAPAFAWLAGGIGSHLISALITIGVAVASAILAWEFGRALLERSMSRLGGDGHQPSARLLTLLPLLRTALLATISTVVGLTALSEIGVNIAPLLAGAGIAGIAVGFGAQHLVQDVITGMFVVFENAIQIGDAVVVAGLSGSVEQLSVRTIRLRAGDGALHIIPFSAVTSITNSNRGLGNAAVSVTVRYDQDTDRVCEALRGIAAGMRTEADFASSMLGDLQVFGVDQVRPWGATITGQIPCTDTGRWSVQREFNRRLKKRFEELDIALSGPPAAAL